MANFSFMDKLRSFLGLQEQLRNDFRNPIWGDDDDDEDELYERQSQVNVYSDQLLHRELTRQMQEFMATFGSMFGDMKTFFHEDFNMPSITDIPDRNPSDPDSQDSNSLRNYYLKPGFQRNRLMPNQDIDLDGKISSQEISGLLKKSDDQNNSPVTFFDGNVVPGRSFCQTIITTSVTKPDGSVETHRIVKNGNKVTEETTTTTPTPGREPKGPVNMGVDNLNPDAIYSSIVAELSSLWKNFQ